MRPSILLSCFALFFSASAAAYTFRLDTGYHITTPSYCNKLRVIDLRKFKDNLGYVRKHGKSTLNPEAALDKMLPAYFENIQKGNSTGNEELLMVLYNIMIEEEPNGQKIGTFYFDCDFYRGMDGKYKFAGKVDSMYEINLMKAGVIGMARTQINIWLTRYACQPQDKSGYLLTEPILLQRREQEKMQYPIYKTTAYKKGMYFTAEQFLNNEPDKRVVIKEEYKPYANPVETYFYYTDEHGNKGERIKEKDFFAYYDTAWYVSSMPWAAAMQYRDGDFYAEQSFHGAATYKADAGLVAGAIVAGGLVGGAIGGAIAGGIVGDMEAPNGNKSGRGLGLYLAKFDPEAKAFRPIHRIE